MSSKNSDSGVVIKMSAGARENALRSFAGVSPVRTATCTSRQGTPSCSLTARIPAMGCERFFSTSAARAFSGET